jgi:hypothetical protein
MNCQTADAVLYENFTAYVLSYKTLNLNRR